MYYYELLVQTIIALHMHAHIIVVGTRDHMIAVLLRMLLHIELIPNCTQASMHRVSINYTAMIIITWNTGAVLAIIGKQGQIEGALEEK